MLHFLLAALASSTLEARRPGTPDVKVTWHDSLVDHFSFSDARTFKQRVLVHDGFWKPGGPILFYCGNEASVELYVNATGWMWEHAEELGALLVFAEHRYYGETQPLGGSSATNASTLRWLTLEQALADYATLIHRLKLSLGAPDAKVVAIGGSYGGTLAVARCSLLPGNRPGSCT